MISILDVEPCRKVSLVCSLPCACSAHSPPRGDTIVLPNFFPCPRPGAVLAPLRILSSIYRLGHVIALLVVAGQVETAHHICLHGSSVAFARKGIYDMQVPFLGRIGRAEWVGSSLLYSLSLSFSLFLPLSLYTGYFVTRQKLTVHTHQQWN